MTGDHWGVGGGKGVCVHYHWDHNTDAKCDQRLVGSGKDFHPVYASTRITMIDLIEDWRPVGSGKGFMSEYALPGKNSTGKSTWESLCLKGEACSANHVLYLKGTPHPGCHNPPVSWHAHGRQLENLVRKVQW